VPFPRRRLGARQIGATAADPIRASADGDVQRPSNELLSPNQSPIEVAWVVAPIRKGRHPSIGVGRTGGHRPTGGVVPLI